MSSSKPVTPRSAAAILIFTSVLGGSAYLCGQAALHHLSPAQLAAGRFVVGGCSLFVLMRLSGVRLSGELIRAAFPAGVALAAGVLALFWGLRGSQSSVAAFLACSDAFFIPVVDRILTGRATSRGTLAALAVGAVGLGLLTIRSGFAISASDAVILLGALAFAVYCVFIANAMQRHGATAVACVSQFTAALCCQILVISESSPLLPGTVPGLLWVLYFGLIITGFRFALQAKAQQTLTPSRVGLIFLVEPLTATVLGVAVEGELLTPYQWLGCVLIVSAVALPMVGSLDSARRRAVQGFE